jgi:hypothetical protein
MIRLISEKSQPATTFVYAEAASPVHSCTHIIHQIKTISYILELPSLLRAQLATRKASERQHW